MANGESDYARLRAAGVTFEEEPRDEPYGTVAVFHDLQATAGTCSSLGGPPRGRTADRESACFG